jgi:hypothetical protein
MAAKIKVAGLYSELINHKLKTLSDSTLTTKKHLATKL